MHKSYAHLLERLKAEANRIYPSDPARDQAVLDMMLATMYEMLEKLADREARFLIKED